MSRPPNDPLDEYRALRRRMAAIGAEMKARRGELLVFPPIGYRIDLDGPRPRPVPDPLLGPLVAEAFRRYSTGKHSLRGLAGLMAGRGLVARSDRPMGPSGLWTVLTNPFYCGRVRWGGELIEGGHEALVAQELFDQVQLRLSGRRH